MYYLYYKIQNEMFTLLPKSRRNNVYCRKLPKLNIDIELKNLDVTNPNYKYYINMYYHEIQCFVNKITTDTKKYNKKTQHPQGHKCGYDHSTARYCWVNFIPAMFNTRGDESYTIEFRMASATTSYIKNKNWLLICMGLVDIIENHKKEILQMPNIGLKDIMTISYNSNSGPIIEFINDRITLFNTSSDRENTKIEQLDYLDNEIDEDLSIKNL